MNAPSMMGCAGKVLIATAVCVAAEFVLSAALALRQISAEGATGFAIPLGGVLEAVVVAVPIGVLAGTLWQFAARK